MLVVCTTLAILPFAPIFLHGIHRGGLSPPAHRWRARAERCTFVRAQAAATFGRVRSSKVTLIIYQTLKAQKFPTLCGVCALALSCRPVL